MPAAPRKTVESQRLLARINAFRTARNWSGTELANRMTAAGHPTNPNAIHQWHSNPNVAITADQIVALVTAFGITFDELFGVGTCKTCGDSPPTGFTCSSCGAAS